MESVANGSQGAGVMTLSGELTVHCADRLKAELMEALSSMDHLVLNLDAVTEVDLSFFQLICSAHRTSRQWNKTLALAGSIPEPLQRAVDILGYPYSLCCRLELISTCLWSGGGK